MTVLKNINEISNYKEILLYYAKLFRDVTKNSNVSLKYNHFYNSTYFLHDEIENITTFKIAIPFNINKYLDSNGSGLLSCVKEVSNLKRSIFDFNVSETQLYDSDTDLNINPTLNAERQFVDTIIKLHNCNFPDLSLSLFSKEETNYDESKQELDLNEINVNYSNISIEINIKHEESFSFNIQTVKRSIIKTKKITKIKNNFTFKKAIKNKPTSLMYDFSFRIETERIEKTHKVDITGSIDDIFREHDTLGEYIASLSNDDGEGKFLNRSGYLQIANEKADGVDNIGRLDYDDYKNLNKEEFEVFIKENTGAETLTIGQINLSGEIKAGFDVSPKPENVFDDMDMSELEAMFESESGSGFDNRTAQEIKETDFLQSMEKLREFRKDARIPNDFGLILPDLQGLTGMDTGKLNWKEISTGYIDQMNLDLGSLELRLQVFPEPPPSLTGGSGGSGLGGGGVGGGSGGGTYDDRLPDQPSVRASETKVRFNGMSSLAGSIQKNITTRMIGGLVNDFSSLIEDVDISQFMSNGGSMFGTPGASGGMSGGKGSFETKTGSSNGTASGKDGKLGGGSASGQFGYESSPPRNFLPPVESFNFKNIDQPSFSVNMDISVKANFDQLDVPELSLDLLEGFIDKTIFGDAEKLVKQMAEGAGIGNGNSSAKKSSYKETNEVNAKEKTGTEAFTEKEKKERKKELKAARADFDKIDAWYDENYKDYVGNIYGTEEDNVLTIEKTLKIDKFNQENLDLDTGLFGTNKLTPYLEMMGKQIDIFNLHQVENIKDRFLDDVESSGHVFQKIRGIRKRDYKIDYNINFESVFKYGIKISNESYNNVIYYNSDHGVAKAEDESDFEITLNYESVQSRTHYSDWKNRIRINSNHGVEKFRIFEDNQTTINISSDPNILRIKEEDFDYTIDYYSDHGVLKARDYSEFNFNQYYSGYLRLKKLADILYEIVYEENQYKLKASDESDYEITLDFSSQKEINKLSDIQYDLDYLSELILARGDILYEINYTISQKIQSVVNVNLNYNFEYDIDSYEQVTSLNYDLNYHDVSAGISRGSDYQFNIDYISDHGVLKFRHITDYELDLTIEYLKIERHNKNNNLNYELINTSIHQYEKWDFEFIHDVLKSYREVTGYSDIEYVLNYITNNYKIGDNYIILRVNGKPIKLGSKYLTIPAKRWNHVELTYDITYDHV